MAILRFLALPFRAPLVTVMFGVAILMGNHWSIIQSQHGLDPQLFWCVEVVQVVVIVFLCTMPDLLMRQVSMLMAISRAISLVIILLLVILGGLYLLRLSILSDVLILASSVLLARLDLARINVLPSPAITSMTLGGILLSGIWLGQLLPTPFLAGWA
ncbi:MAG: hypothetical protein AB8E74_01430 [Prochlorococcus sp.]